VPEPADCISLDAGAPWAGERGEGALRGTYGPTWAGRSPNDTGGGGGSCEGSGGGGGARWGAGGEGSRGEQSLQGGGLGGAPLPRPGLGFGGGGGAANGSFGNWSAGGRGGGALLIRAASLRGAGSIFADGVDSVPIDPRFGAPGGAGAGGTVHLEITGELSCRAFARGGNGAVPQGGGGGGGLVVLRAGRVVDCPAAAGGGQSGVPGASLPAPGESGSIAVEESPALRFPGGPGPSLIGVGCGCASSPAPLLLLLAALVRRRWERRA
jgi:hypothetical protein